MSTAIPKELFQAIRRIEITTTHTVNDVLAGAYHSAFKGQGMEFEDVRSYQPGDDVRSIDWNVTARMGSPFVKRFREERELTVILVVDISASARFGTGSRLKSEAIAEIAGMLAFSAIKNNDRVGLLLFSDRIEQYLPPKKGVKHVLRVIRDLLAFEAKGQGTNISGALEFLGRVHKKKGVCFLISDFIAEDYGTALMLTARKQDLIAVRVSDPLESEFPSMGLLTVRDLESGEIRIVDSGDLDIQEQLPKRNEERVEEHQRIVRRSGAGLIAIEDSGDIIGPLERFFQARGRRR